LELHGGDLRANVYRVSIASLATFPLKLPYASSLFS
jgi:hypothetical protein